MIIQSIYAAVVLVMARKRRVNPWGWIIGSLVPAAGMLVSGIFMLVTMLSILDRLNDLEMNKNFN